MAKYNGHRNYNAWNVSLWINNDEMLYRMARSMCINEGIGAAATRLFDMYLSGKKTGDGVPYTRTNVRLALRGILS